MDTPRWKLDQYCVEISTCEFGHNCSGERCLLIWNPYFHLNIDIKPEMAPEKGNAQWKQMTTETKVESGTAAIYLNI